MPAPSDKPLRRVDMNLYTDDVDWLENRFGRGWTSEVREIIAKYVKEKKREQA